MTIFNEYNRPALKSAVYFFIFGFFWILLSDRFLLQIVPDLALAAKLQTYKGWLFICLTAGLIYVIVRRQLKMVITLKNEFQLSERRYKQIVEMSHDVIWTADSKGVIKFINKSSSHIYGFDPTEMIGRSFIEFIEKEEYDKNLKVFYENLQHGITSTQYHTVFENKSRQKVFLQDNVNAILDNNGELVEIIGASKDITKDKLFEKQLVEANIRLETALKGGELGLWDFTMKTQELFVNETWDDILGQQLSDKKLNSDFYLSILHPDDRETIHNAYDRFILNNSDNLDIENRLRHSDGSWRWVLSKGKVASRDENGNPIRLIGTSQDITAKKQLELDLKYWLDIYRSFIKYANEGIFLHEVTIPIDQNIPEEKQVDILFNHGFIKTCNDSFAAMYGYDHANELEGFTLAQLQGGDDNPHNITFLKQFIRSNYRLNNEISYDLDKNGNHLYISNNLVGIHEEGKLVRIWGSQFDITQQVLAQKKLEGSEQRYRLLFETNPVPFIIFDFTNYAFYDANSAAEKLFNRSRYEMLKLNLLDIRPEMAFYSQNELQTLLTNELLTTTELSLKVSKDKSIQAEVNTALIDYENKKAVIAAINDITLLREAEKMVIRSLIEGEDNERKRVAKEIHDSLGQNLTAASLNFSALKGVIDKMDESRREKFNIGYNFLNNAIEESRNIALNLMPKAIDDFGLIPSLKSLLSQIEKSAGLKITFYDNLRNDERLPRNIELNLYRITQEAINNVLKHADATKIFIQLLLHKKEIIYTFEDDGKGFDFRSTLQKSKGIGIKSISNRVIAMSGIFEIDSTPGKGTAMTIQIPITQ